MSQRYNMCSPRARKDGKTHWHSVGSAFEDEKGITLYFDSLPLPDAEGRCVVKLFEPRDNDRAKSAQNDRQQAQQRSQGWGGNNDQLDDDIPF